MPINCLTIGISALTIQNPHPGPPLKGGRMEAPKFSDHTSRRRPLKRQLIGVAQHTGNRVNVPSLSPSTGTRRPWPDRRGNQHVTDLGIGRQAIGMARGRAGCQHLPTRLSKP